MAFNHADVVKAQAEQLTAERAEALGRYEAGRLQEDSDAVMYAAGQIVDCDAKMAALNRIAHNLAAPRQAPLQGEDEMSRSDAALARHYGLTGTQLSVAKGWTTDSRMSDEDRVRTYLLNRQKLPAYNAGRREYEGR